MARLFVLSMILYSSCLVQYISLASPLPVAPLAAIAAAQAVNQHMVQEAEAIGGMIEGGAKRKLQREQSRTVLTDQAVQKVKNDQEAEYQKRLQNEQLNLQRQQLATDEKRMESSKARLKELSAKEAAVEADQEKAARGKEKAIPEKAANENTATDEGAAEEEAGKKAEDKKKAAEEKKKAKIAAKKAKKLKQKEEQIKKEYEASMAQMNAQQQMPQMQTGYSPYSMHPGITSPQYEVPMSAYQGYGFDPMTASPALMAVA